MVLRPFMHRVFLLSPAHSGGSRAKMLLRPGATFELARQVQIGDAVLGNVFAFCSGLYFRGKLAYARQFGAAPSGKEGALIITPSRGLVPWNLRVGIADLEEFASVPVDSADSRYTTPLEAAARELAAMEACEFVLLGSVATGKYVDSLLPMLGSRLLFPDDFIGRGDMSRGALLLRQTNERTELRYSPIAGAVRRGRRAPSVARQPPRSTKPGASRPKRPLRFPTDSLLAPSRRIAKSAAP